MSESNGNPDTRVLREAYRKARDGILRLEDSFEAYERATQLANDLREMADSAAQLRAALVARAGTAEGLSLSELAKRLGMSKARVGQLLQVARADHQANGGASAKP